MDNEAGIGLLTVVSLGSMHLVSLSKITTNSDIGNAAGGLNRLPLI
jgi:hypothetical protein